MFKFRNYLPVLYMKCTGIKIGKGARIIGYPFLFRYPGSIMEIGKNCAINSNFFSNLMGLYQRTIIVSRGGKVYIGNHVGISGSTIYCREKIVIGDDTLIGANCKIIDNDFHEINAEIRIQNKLNGEKELITGQEIRIGRNVFVGCNSIILKGTVIGDNCTIGAGSIVHGSFKDNCVIAGNPAKVIREKY